MLRSIIDVNLPKFLTQDLQLFNGILSDLFPGVALPDAHHEHITAALREACTHFGLQLEPAFLTKALQTNELLLVRHGVMVVGGSHAGKSRSWQCLAKALSNSEEGEARLRTSTCCINPKAITLKQLYGQNDVSMVPLPPLYEPRPCPSYSRRRDRNNCVRNLITYEM